MVSSDRAGASPTALRRRAKAILSVEARTVLMAAERGSLSELARELGITQASVSRRVGALERKLGLRVFERSNKGVRLTAEGAALAGRLREVNRLIAAAL